MKTNEIQIGASYTIKIGANTVAVTITAYDGDVWIGQTHKGAAIRIKDPARLTANRDTVEPKPTQAQVCQAFDTLAKQKKAGRKAKPAKQSHTREPGSHGGQRAMSLLDAAADLLSAGTGNAMRCKDIVDLAIERKLWSPRNGGKTPANTLHAAINREIKVKGDDSRFTQSRTREICPGGQGLIRP